MKPIEFFEKVYVINLKSRPDRLHSLLGSLKKHGWPFKWPEVWEAVPGGDGTVPCPISFREGGGAFGCRQSHVGILQHCLMQDIRSVLVLEDDAFVRSGFPEQVQDFLDRVPSDWQGMMLGGQHHASPTKVVEGVVKCNYVQRTHAYGCRGDYLRGLYQRWVNATVHIDWLMSGWQHDFPVYAPERWLVGQARSRSDICGRTNAATMWNSVNRDEYGPVVLLSVPRDVMLQLREIGFHTGYSLASDDIDEGLAEVFAIESAQKRVARLTHWLDVIQHECAQGEDLVASVWHPSATAEIVRNAAEEQPFYEIVGNTLDEALSSLPSEVRKAYGSVSPDRLPILLLRANRAVVQELRRRGFHTGYWRDEISDIDRGLREVYEGDLDPVGRKEKLSEWCHVLRDEASTFGGIVVAWHPQAIPNDFSSVGEDVIEIEADSAEQAMAAWKEATSASGISR